MLVNVHVSLCDKLIHFSHLWVFSQYSGMFFSVMWLFTKYYHVMLADIITTDAETVIN